MVIRTPLFMLALLLAQVVPVGCPLVNSGGNSTGEQVLNIVISGPSQAAVGETIDLAAAPSDDSTVTTGLKYAWYQTSGHAVGLWNADTDTVEYIAPSVKTDQTLKFRVDVRSAAGLLASAEYTMILLADPNAVPATDPNALDPFPQVKLTTSMGEIIVELNRDKAPLSTNNFLRYVDEGFYNGTVFHRVIADFVVQGGGFDENFKQKTTHDPIANEANNGLKNIRASVAMARTNDPNSATAQFYVNLKANTDLDYTASNAGYAVFGKVISGMDVVDEIAKVKTGSKNGMSDVPLVNVVLQTAERVKASDGSDALDPNSDPNGSSSGLP